MSVASTRDADVESAAADLPDRPISSQPNLVTASGLAALDAALAEAKAAYALAQSAAGIGADRTPMARATRDLRYYAARRASAQRLDTSGESMVVRFGDTVTFERDDGRRQTYRIVGEDEADPAAGAISYVSPLARALLGKTVGDTAALGDGELEVLEFRSPPDR